MMIVIYRLVFILLKSLLLVLKPFLSSKLQKWIELRQYQSNSSLKNSYWFHASSGEIEYVKSLIIEIKKRNSLASIAVTYSSPSAEKLFENIRPFVNELRPLTWDQPAAIQNLLKQFDPQILIFSRTDFWPELIFQTHKAQIPMAIISYYNPQNISFFQKWLLKNMTFISCVDEPTYKNLLKTLPSTVKITCDGDTRFDQVFWRLQQPAKIDVLSHRPLFVCGSTWPEDEIQLHAVFKKLIQEQFQVVWSPHEVSAESIQKVFIFLKKENFSYQVLSAETKPSFALNADFLVVDQIGYLADLYRKADIAFVGGSFKEKVHSVMEPLCCGLPVLLGPYFKNNPEAVKYERSQNPQVIFTAHNSDALLQAIKNIQAQGPQLKTQIKALMQTNQNATKKITQTLLDTVLKKVDF